ncbi:MAG: YHS domain-containing (seleno)protein [Cytophagales bacterium]|nr:YHS domain-containing (seleno)protein [Cytophagales bacterium]
MITLIEDIQDYIYSNEDGAIEGYDPVAYFTDSKPMKGKKDFTYQWKDANWYFVSEKNRDLFKANPEAYAPQFGGYCAFAVSEGETEEIDPMAWKVVEGKLYLNYDLETRDDWEAEQAERIKMAEGHWQTALQKFDN